MQQLNGSSYGVFTISYAIDITFVLHPKQSIYIVLEMQLPLHTNINNKNLSPSPKHITMELAVTSNVQWHGAQVYKKCWIGI
jgi:hypothetical protein